MHHDIAPYIDAASVDELKLMLAAVESRLTEAGVMTRVHAQGSGSVDVSDGTKHLSTQEMALAEEAFAAWCDEAKNEGQKSSRMRLYLAFLLVRHGALRLGEVLALDEQKDILPGKNMVRAGGREVLLAPRVMRTIAAIAGAPFFAGMRGSVLRLDQGYLRRIFGERAKECGLPPGLLNPRVLRQSRAIELLRGGAPVRVVDFYLGRGSASPGVKALAFSKAAAHRIIHQCIRREERMKTSARNAFTGTVTKVVRDKVVAEVELATLNGLNLVAVITEDSLTNLGLEPGSTVTATVKAPLVMLTEGKDGLKTSARNKFSGKVAELKLSDIACEVIVDLDAGGKVCAVVTKESVDNLTLAPGKEVLVMFKAFAVVLNVE